MTQLMRCPYCGLLQGEPSGVKTCSRCGGGLEYEDQSTGRQTYLQVQMELDQIAAPANQNIERYLLVSIRTPRQVPPQEAMTPESKRPALNFAAVLDVSGSMQGEKIIQARLAVERAAQYLQPGDIFSLVTFSSEVACPLEPSRVGDQTYEAVKNALRMVNAGGTTALCAGLETGIQKAQTLVKDSNLVLLLSDGQANVGETDLEKIGYRAYEARQQGSLISCLGLGLDYNEALLSEIATQGGGRFYHVQNANQIPAFLAGELGEVAALAARNVRLHLAIPEGATLIPLSSAYPVQQLGGQTIVTVGDIPCDSELEIPLRLALLAQPAGSKFSVEGDLLFRTPAGNELQCPVNRVTIRFETTSGFKSRQGVVRPVAERVFAQMKAASVLGVARKMVQEPAEIERWTESVLIDLRCYADLLGEGRADAEAEAVLMQFSTMRDSSATAKKNVADAYRLMRAAKDFNR